MKLRSFFYSLAASVLVLLLVGGSIFFWLVAQSPLSLLEGRLPVPDAAMFVPRQAPAMVSLLVNPDHLEAFRQVVASPQTRRRSRAEFHQFRQSLLSSTGLDYQTDIQPWLGEEITFAVTTPDIDRQSENGRQPGYLLALNIRDLEQSREFLQRFWQKQALTGRELIVERYQGVELIHARPSLPAVKPLSSSSQSSSDKPDSSLKSLATARVGDRFVLFANHPKVLRQAINNVQVPDLGLPSTRQYQQALASLQQGRIGFTFLNLPQLFAGNSSSEAGSPQPLSQTLNQTYGRLAVGLGLNRQGLLAEMALVSATEKQASETKPALPLVARPVQALQYLPANTPLVASGVALNQLWSQVSTQFMGYDFVAELVNQPLEDLKTHWKLDLPQDIFAWVKGEYAVAMMPRSRSDSREVSLTSSDSRVFRPDWLFVAERTEPETVQSAMQHLDTIAQQQGLGVGPLEGQRISTWTQLVTAATQPVLEEPSSAVLPVRVVGAHTEAGNYQILATSLEVASQALKAPQNSLANSEYFKAAIAPLPQPNNGYFYLDWAGSHPILEQQFPLLRVVEVAGKPLFSHLRSLALSSYGEEAGVYRSQIFIRLG
jgi:hypothetical protein